MAKIVAVCKSEEKGCRKKASAEGALKEDYGLIGDAHAEFGSHRQLSLLAIESIEKIRKLGADVNPGDFAENITTDGIELHTLPIGTRFKVGNEIILELTQIGKECHDRCAIFKQVGTCVMPVEGVFTRIINGGVVRVGDEIKVI